jgi:hypothetical protein
MQTFGSFHALTALLAMESKKSTGLGALLLIIGQLLWVAKVDQVTTRAIVEEYLKFFLYI